MRLRAIDGGAPWHKSAHTARPSSSAKVATVGNVVFVSAARKPQDQEDRLAAIESALLSLTNAVNALVAKLGAKEHISAKAARAAFKDEEKRRMVEALDRTGWVVKDAARRIRMPLRTFNRRMDAYKIPRPRDLRRAVVREAGAIVVVIFVD